MALFLRGIIECLLLLCAIVAISACNNNDSCPLDPDSLCGETNADSPALSAVGALSGLRIGATLEPQEIADEYYTGTLLREFGALTPENALKMYSIQNNRGIWNFAGADAVMVGGCHPGDCHYVSGNYKARRRMAMLQNIFESLGLDANRIWTRWISASEGPEFAAAVREITEETRKQGPNPLSANWAL